VRAIAQHRQAWDVVDVWIFRDIPERQVLTMAGDERVWLTTREGEPYPPPTLSFHHMEFEAIKDAIDKIRRPKDLAQIEFVLDQLERERSQADRFLTMIEKRWEAE
jgi:hypothetical protein